MKFLKKIMVPLAAGLAFMAGPANAAKVTMNIGYSVNEGHPYGTFMNLFAERFETLSGGTVRVKVHCCHKMGSEQEQFKKIAAWNTGRDYDSPKQRWAIFSKD